MHKNPVVRIYVDHYLQAALLSCLSKADRPLRFSELKEDGIENSLFMYHANKLIARGAITKDDDGFRLSANGARWINSVEPDMTHAQTTAKPLVQLVVRDNRDRILISMRKGQLKELLNDYMLPGGVHKSGMSADENAQRVIRKIFGEIQCEPRLLSTVENITTYSDGFIYHSIAHIYEVDLEAAVNTVKDDRFAFEWVALSDIHTDNPRFAKSLSVPTIIQKLQTGTLQSHEVIRLTYS
jgi:ADP-ribose pyrophosphatase YjhB (NUDIX family)